MAERVLLVHGWSVTETTTYQALHLQLSRHGYDLEEIHLGRYVSLDNEVQVRDIAKAMQNALLERLGNPPWKEPFHVITHSTGALVVKEWIVNWYTGSRCENKPLRNIVFLAGPHFGSRLAHHGRSMLATALYWGDTGRSVLVSLELGSEFSWSSNADWLDGANWRDKGIRPYCLAGDRVEKNFFKSKIFPAAYEEGSDMVVRVPAANLNFRRFRLGRSRKLVPVGAVQDVPFAALGDHVHSGPDAGIMNSIKRKSTPATHQPLDLILRCLRVKSAADYRKMRAELAAVTKKTRTRTRRRRHAHAQIDFRFTADDGSPIDDYRFELGVVVKGRDRPSRSVAHVHKNIANRNHFTVFLDLREFDPKLKYFMNFCADSGTELLSFQPEPFRVDVEGKRLREVICEDQTTQIDVTLGREPHRNLFRFHSGNDPKLHVSWNREGEIDRENLEIL